MATPVIMPRQGQSVESCIIAKWFKKKGDDVPVLTEVCIIGSEGEYSGKPASEIQTKISPRARALAKRLGIEYRYAVPTGSGGRIREKDIISLNEQTQKVQQPDKNVIVAQGSNLDFSNPDFIEVKLSDARKLTGKTMHNSLSSTAQLTLNTSFDASDALAFIKKVRESGHKLNLEDITLNDVILFAVSRTILNTKELNAHFMTDKMLCFKNVHLGVAVNTEEGLKVPVLFNADSMSLNEIAHKVKGLVEKCRKETAELYFPEGASFTVTDMGNLDIESFTPVLFPPQTGILGVNTVVYRTKEVNGHQSYYPSVGLSLTFDHRAIDGAPAARFLKELKHFLEDISVLLVR